VPSRVARNHSFPTIFVVGIVGGVLLGVAFSLDSLIRETVKPWRTPTMLAVASWVTRFGYGWVLGVAGAIIAGVGYWSGQSRWVRAGLVNIPALVVSGLATRVLKIGVGRPRPRLIDQGVEHWGPSFVSGLNSFPSGHATSAFTFAVILAIYNPSWRIVAYIVAVSVALSRIVLDAHFLSDVVGGALVGFLVGRAAVAVTDRHWPEPTTPQSSSAE